MIPVEVSTPIWRWVNFNDNLKKEGLDNSVNLIEEIKIMSHIRESLQQNKEWLGGSMLEFVKEAFKRVT